MVDDKSGKFLAHTDPTLSGLDAGDYVGADLIGRNFEGFSDYMGSYSYVSEVTRDERSVMVVSRDVLSALTTTTNVELFCLPIIVLFALYYLIACPLVARHPMAMDERTMRGSPLRVFGFGFVIYFCALALVSARLSSRGAWPSFDFVFARHWANGVHLFSLIYALFFVSCALVVAYVLRSVLAHVGPANTHAKTLVRLTHSLVGYVVALVLLFGLLSLFGVDTATLLASAGIVSIAIGMGAKDLVTDVLAGLFLIFEGAIHVGDIVEVGSWHGRVTDMGIRTCSITNENNDVKIITNSNVSDIVNKSLSKSISTFEFEIKRDVEIDGVEGLVRRYIDRAVADIPELASTLEYAGIVGLTDDAYTVRLVFACNEDRRESLSTRLGTAMKLILEGVTAQEGTAQEVQAENE